MRRGVEGGVGGDGLERVCEGLGRVIIAIVGQRSSVGRAAVL